jgi:hypothetical protein
VLLLSATGLVLVWAKKSWEHPCKDGECFPEILQFRKSKSTVLNMWNSGYIGKTSIPIRTTVKNEDEKERKKIRRKYIFS